MMASEDIDVLEAMKVYGGGFVKALAELGFRADAANLARLKAAWPEYWAEYTKIAARMEERA